LLARRFGLHALSEAERAGLIASLDEAERDIDEGRTYNGDQLRQAVRSTKSYPQISRIAQIDNC
jgi:hypothetical protein